MGDFNFRGYEAARSGETNECMVFRQLFEEELFMNQFVTEPTRQRSILDLVFSDNRELVSNIAVFEGLGDSDHNIIKFTVTSEGRPNDNLHNVPNFNRADFEKMRNELAQIDWNVELRGLNACETWEIFKTTSILNNIQKRYIPLKFKRSRKRDNPPWLTPEVRKVIRTKIKAFKALKRSFKEPNTKRNYQKNRDEVKKNVRAAKRAKEIDLARQCNADSKNSLVFIN